MSGVRTDWELEEEIMGHLHISVADALAGLSDAVSPTLTCKLSR